MLTPARAISIPKCFSIFLSSRIVLDMSALPRDEAADIRVQDNGNEQDDA
jgi:hypothetical protein